MSIDRWNDWEGTWLIVYSILWRFERINYTSTVETRSCSISMYLVRFMMRGTDGWNAENWWTCASHLLCESCPGQPANLRYWSKEITVTSECTSSSLQYTDLRCYVFLKVSLSLPLLRRCIHYLYTYLQPQTTSVLFYDQ